MLKGLTAGYYDLQFTVKTGENKPWSDRRVRQAVNLAINRVDLGDKVFGGQTQYSGFVPPGYRAMAADPGRAQTKYQKFDLVAAKSLMQSAGFQNGFPVSLIIRRFRLHADRGAPPELPEADQHHLDDPDGRLADLLEGLCDRRLRTRLPLKLHAGSGATWWLRQRLQPGHLAELRPTGSTATRTSRCGGSSATARSPSTRRSACRCTHLRRILLTELLEVPLLVAYKYQVVDGALAQHVRVRTPTSTRACERRWFDPSGA